MSDHAQSPAPYLLNDDGSASVATVVMTSHHGFRRDLARFATALRRRGDAGASRAEALQQEWQHFRGALHAHHNAEDQRLFQALKGQHSDLAPVIDQLTVEHRHIDPLLEGGDVAFAALSHPNEASLDAAARVVDELASLLGPHLALEEARLTPILRVWKELPLPPPAEIPHLIDGLAWGCHGVAPDVLESVLLMLPRSVADQLPAARTAFAQRCLHVWGSDEAGATHTPIPDPKSVTVG